MYRALPDHANKVQGVKVSPWIAVPNADYCSMRIVEGTDPQVIANRVAFIEKTPRVRIHAFDGSSEDCRNWHAAWKGDDGWDPAAQGWCDQLLLGMGYDVPDAKPFDDSMI